MLMIYVNLAQPFFWAKAMPTADNCDWCQQGHATHKNLLQIYIKATGVQQEVMCDEIETVKRFCYLDCKLNASGEYEAAVAARTRLGWNKFREYGEVLFEKRFSL